MSHRKSYDVLFKLKAIETAEKKSKEAAAREFRVDAKRVREWCQQKDQLLALKKKGKSKRRRLKGAGRKAKDAEMEEELFEWVCEMRSRNLRVTRRMIRHQAKAISTDSLFKASVGWLRRFMKRNGLSLRRRTTLCQTVPADCIPKLVDYIIHLHSLQSHHKYQDGNIFAMDETACYMDMTADTTVTQTGARSVPLKTTGHEKEHFTVILTAKADGTKLKPFVVFKGKGTRLMKTLGRISGIVVRFSKNGWMNDGLTIEYLNSLIGAFSFHKRLLVWDAYKCHTSETVRAHTRSLRLPAAIVPGGCTKFIQAADVAWNASFKTAMRSHYDTWLSQPDNYEYTRGGNMRAPSRELLCDWVKSSWQSVSAELIKNSFKFCAITTPIDGSEDGEIHCFHPQQPCAAGLSLLQQETAKLNQDQSLPISEDPFANDEDEEETNINEVVIESEDESAGEESEQDTCSEDESNSSDCSHDDE